MKRVTVTAERGAHRDGVSGSHVAKGVTHRDARQWQPTLSRRVIDFRGKLFSRETDAAMLSVSENCNLFGVPLLLNPQKPG